MGKKKIQAQSEVMELAINAKFNTGAEAVSELRDLAIRYAVNLRKAAAIGKGRSAAESKLIGICTAIEVLTTNGNYYREMNEAVRRAEEQSKTTAPGVAPVESLTSIQQKAAYLRANGWKPAIPARGARRWSNDAWPASQYRAMATTFAYQAQKALERKARHA